MTKAWVLIAVTTTLAVAMLAGAGVIEEKDDSQSSSEDENVVFSHYVTETFTSKQQGHGEHSRLVVFDQNHWYDEEMAYQNDPSNCFAYFNGGDYIGFCGHIGDHHNCIVVSGGGSVNETVPRIPEGATFVDCPVIRDPILGGSKRSLSKCFYIHQEAYSGLHTEWWIEAKTNYPVRKVQYKMSGTLVYNQKLMDYCTFEETLPSDRTKLGPIAGVKVYDLRNGKEGLFTESEDKTQLLQGKEEEESHVVLTTWDLIMNMKKTHISGFVGPSMGPAPVHTMSARDAIPESFDARVQWPMCGVIKEIKDQKGCGSCWAMASSSALADRMCIYTNGATNVSLSPQFMINCLPNQDGCQGGNARDPVWKDLMEVGTVPESCVSYVHGDKTCTGRCDDGSPMPKATKAKNFYSPWGETDKARVEAIQREIMEHGSVAASFVVFSDWKPEKWTVYHRSKTATYEDGHVVRIIGWGTENGEDYWLIANSYGTGFKEGGFFKMHRGINECNIEETVIAGEPLIE